MKKKSSTLHKIVTIVGAVLCAIFGLLLLFNLIIIVKGLVNKDAPPSVFGVTPMVVRTGSMSSDKQHFVKVDELADVTPEQIKSLKVGDTVYTQYGDYKVENVIVSIQSPNSETPVFITERHAKDHIEAGDLIFSVKKDTGELKPGDVISYLENDYVVTHRILSVTPEGFVTKGDANNEIDKDPVKPENVVGLYKSRIPAMGEFIYFLQKPVGMAIFIGVPVVAFIAYEVIRSVKNADEESSENEELRKELERLRALAKEKEKPSANTEE